MEALRKKQKEIRFIQVRHEESAAFMACAYAKYTGRLGVCLATSGPGGIHLLNGLYDAKLDGQPVLAITGHAYHDLIDTFSQQDVDLDKLFQDVAVYNARIMGPAHVLHPIDFAAFARACGAGGYTIDDPATCGAILDEALNAPGPAVIEAVVDPNEPPTPPKITAKQAAHFAESLAKGTPHGGKIALTVLADKVKEMV
jgi:thiamine pyrophosphate-dependent acetolactate synthase large subunit-like protein